MKKLGLLVVAICFTLLSFAQEAAEKINQANEALVAKDYTKALELYEDAMSNLGNVEVPESINYNIGLAAYNSKSYDKAVSYFDKAIAANANVAKAHDYKARSYSKLKDYENAVASYEAEIAATDGDTKAIVYNTGIMSYKGKMYDKAISYFNKSVESGYKGSTAQYYKTVILKKQKKNDEYKAALEKGAEMFPGDKKLCPALAKVYVSEGNALYKKGAAILSTANDKVNAGTLKTDDAAYTTEFEKAKVEFKAAVEILEKAKAADASNKNAQTLIDACNAVL